jgi:hypothetical protein
VIDRPTNLGRVIKMSRLEHEDQAASLDSELKVSEEIRRLIEPGTEE